MSQGSDSEVRLRRSLEAIDSIRQRMLLAGYTTVGGTFAAFLWLSYVASTSTNVKSVVMAAVLALTCLIAWSTFALSLFITRMTGRILRAIDFAVTPAAQ
jgi:hypothetical protein